MNRRGQELSLSTIILICIGLAILGFFLWRSGAVQKMLGTAVEDSTQCPKTDPAFSCLPVGQGCGTGLQTISKLCGTGQVCCYDPAKATSTPGAANANAPTDPNRIAPVAFNAVDSSTRRPIAEYGTTVVSAGQPKSVDLGVVLPACRDCTWTLEQYHTTRAGYNAKPVPPEFGLTEAEVKQRLNNVQLENGPAFIGETITYTALLTPYANRTNGTTHRFTFNYRVTSPVTVTPLSTDWQRSKTVVASCPDSSRPCSMIYYTIQTNPEQCEIPSQQLIEGAVPLPVRYCLTKDKQIERCEFDTLQQCQMAVDGGGAEQSQVIQIITTAAQQGVLGDSQILQYAAWEQETSPYSCQMDLIDRSGGTFLTTFANGVGNIVPIKANDTFNSERQQATIYLDKNFMTDRYLCVYGQDLRDKSKISTAGRPQRITIDTVPPVAQIRFEPLTLRITFSCEDDRSGCKQAYWVQYISDITRFMPALISGGGQSAAIWCPPAQTSSGWRMETKSQVPYTSNEVRVLCLRVEDNAGNAGVTKAVLYNGYQMLQAVIVEAAK